jgi:O-antigen/teichoic acid export membrane protein
MVATTPTSTPGTSVNPISVRKASAFAVGTNVIQVLGGFIAAGVLARLLGPAQKGSYDLYMATAMFLSVILGFALNAGIIYVVASQPVNTARLMRVLALIALGEALVAWGVMYVLGALGRSSSVIPADFGAWGAPVIAGTVFLLSVSIFYRAILVGHRQFIAANRGDVMKQAASLGFIALGVALARFGHVTLLQGVIFANMAAIGIAIASYGFGAPAGQVGTADLGLGRAFRFSLPSYLANASQYLNNRIDLYFIYHYWGTAHVGLYQTSVLIAQSITLLPSAVQGILFPTIASNRFSRQETIATVTRTHRLLFYVGLFMAASAAISGPLMIPLVFGRAFAKSAVSLAILAPGCAVFVTTIVLAAYFAGTGRPKINFINSLIQAVVTIGLDSLVVSRWSYYGAAAVWAFSCLVSSSCCLVVFCRETKVRLSDLYVLNNSDVKLAQQYCRAFASRLAIAKS